MVDESDRYTCSMKVTASYEPSGTEVKSKDSGDEMCHTGQGMTERCANHIEF